MKPLFDWRQYVASDLGPHPTTRHVLLTLSLYMSPKGDSCFPSIDRLVEETGRSRSTVIKHIRIAKEEGWIQVQKHGFSGRRWKRNEYVATVPDEARKLAEKRRKETEVEGSDSAGPAGRLFTHSEALDHFHDNRNDQDFGDMFEPVPDGDTTKFRLR